MIIWIQFNGKECAEATSDGNIVFITVLGIFLQVGCVVFWTQYHDLCIGKIPIQLTKWLLGAFAYDTKRTGEAF